MVGRLVLMLTISACRGGGLGGSTDAGSGEDGDDSGASGDADHDGYAAPDDCDDRDAAVNPGADEVCDAVDNDCDDLVDEDDAVDATTWYLDGDADGYGLDGETIRSCSPPDGYADVGGDCDDEDPDTYPWAPEICDDGIDQDCNGRADNTCLVTWTTDDAGMHLSGEAVSDYAGLSLATPDLDGDGIPELVVGAPGNDQRAMSSGKVYVLPGPLERDATLSDTVATVMTTTASCFLGYGLASVGDLDGDGDDELFVSAFSTDDVATNAGAAYLFEGPMADSLGPDTAHATFSGLTTSASLGMYVTHGAGDVDADGVLDVMLGAHGTDAYRGAVYIFAGPFSGAYDTGDARASVTGSAADALVGYAAVGPGDIDGDGFDDIVVGEPGLGAGAAHLFWGPIEGALTTADADVSLRGSAAGDAMGSLLAAGDLDGDGSLDLEVGARGSDALTPDGGAVLVFFSPATDATPEFSLLGEQTDGALGHHEGDLDLADVDSDGLDDVVVGWHGDDRQDTEAGGAYVIYGPMSGTWHTGQADIAMLGATESYLTGFSVEVGDLDGDGVNDFAVGAKYGDDEKGSVDVFFDVGAW